MSATIRLGSVRIDLHADADLKATAKLLEKVTETNLEALTPQELEFLSGNLSGDESEVALRRLFERAAASPDGVFEPCGAHGDPDPDPDPEKKPDR